tara:strand:+ start:259 stop:783 length:525 start_codon:yes stop_codon:yes gene_type:complete
MVKNQFRYLSELKTVLTKILSNIPTNAVFLYFGDTPNKSKPDVGYTFELISAMRKDISFYMIQIKEEQSWGFPKFVKDVYWHNDYTKKRKWGGIDNGKPCSNTKKWVSLHRYNKIKKGFVLGGGKDTLDEIALFKKLNIEYEYYPIERRYLGDGKTKVKNTDSKKERIGITYRE